MQKKNQNGNDVKKEKFVKFKNIYKRTSYAIKPFLMFVAVLFVTYYGNQVVFWFRGGEGASTYPWLPIDDMIPIVSWFVYFYYLTFPLGLVAFFYLAYANKKAFWRMYYSLIISYVISGIIYFFFQTYFVKPDFIPETFTDRLMVNTWAASINPINCFPSQHTYMAVAMIIACLTAGKDMKWWFKIFTIFCGIMIILSTFFIKQHYFLDWIVSTIIMVVAYFGVLVYEKKKAKQHKCSKQTIKS